MKKNVVHSQTRGRGGRGRGGWDFNQIGHQILRARLAQSPIKVRKYRAHDLQKSLVLSVGYLLPVGYLLHGIASNKSLKHMDTKNVSQCLCSNQMLQIRFPPFARKWRARNVAMYLNNESVRIQ
jgi:hypothetical protein